MFEVARLIKDLTKTEYGNVCASSTGQSAGIRIFEHGLSLAANQAHR